jgi:hypothetical protein
MPTASLPPALSPSFPELFLPLPVTPVHLPVLSSLSMPAVISAEYVAIEATFKVVVSTESVEVPTADQLVESVHVAEFSSMSQVMSISKSRPEVAVLPWKCTWLGPMVMVIDFEGIRQYCYLRTACRTMTKTYRTVSATEICEGVVSCGCTLKGDDGGARTGV